MAGQQHTCHRDAEFKLWAELLGEIKNDTKWIKARLEKGERDFTEIRGDVTQLKIAQAGMAGESKGREWSVSRILTLVGTIAAVAAAVGAFVIYK